MVEINFDNDDVIEVDKDFDVFCEEFEEALKIMEQETKVPRFLCVEDKKSKAIINIDKVNSIIGEENENIK